MTSGEKAQWKEMYARQQLGYRLAERERFRHIRTRSYSREVEKLNVSPEWLRPNPLRARSGLEVFYAVLKRSL